MNPDMIDPGLNLYIDIGTECNMHCPFCIAPTKGRKNGPGFYDGLEYALEWAWRHKASIQVVGGEPLCSGRFQQVMTRLRTHPYRRIVLNTNGTAPSLTQLELIKGCVTNVNVSCHSPLDILNKRLMGEHCPPIFALLNTVTVYREANTAVRLNCNLIRGYVDNIETLDNYMSLAHSLHVREVSFSQLFPLGLFDYQTPPEPGYTESHQINLGQLIYELDSSPHYAPYTINKGEVSLWGQSTWGRMPHRRYWMDIAHKIIISVKTMSGYNEQCMPLPTVYDKATDPELQDTICFAVLHPDGRLTASWDREERILYEPDVRSLLLDAESLSFAQSRV